MDLKTPIVKASMAYKMYARRLEKLGILTLEDFLYHIPFRYEDYSLISEIAKVQTGETVTIKGIVKEINNQYTRYRKSLQKAKVSDQSGTIDILWFNQPFLLKTIKEGEKISVSGKVSLSKRKQIFISPNFEIIFNNQPIHTGRLVPVYPETRGISSKWLRRQVFNILQESKQIEEYLPREILENEKLMELESAIKTVHFPDSLENALEAKKRLAFDELFKIQLASIMRRKSWTKEKIKPWQINQFKTSVENFISKLPFELTNAQKKAVEEILNDLSTETPMNRLLEGDVGSGKTIVATIASYLAFLNGFQTAFMAPTEILANQHYTTLTKLLSCLNIKVALLTGSRKDKIKGFDIIIGTHALIDKKVKFQNLGLIVIDEQQRFGVEQRGILRSKGQNPHVLIMTATPIPRTVALTLYGDLDLSILDQMPKERLPVKTWLVPPVKRENAYQWIEEKIAKNKDQVFIICPFIEESESMVSVKAASKEFERLKKEVFPNLRLGLLHGKMKSNEKEETLDKFRKNKFDILVCTPVVEVGIDIPNATIILIEEAERFGLAQLHQMRGRVGRSSKQSFCLLFTQSTNPATVQRLRSMESIYSGALLAELDLKLRGPGQIYGTLQHGAQNLKVASFSDFELIEKTKKIAQEIFAKLDEYPILKNEVEKGLTKKISPD